MAQRRLLAFDISFGVPAEINSSDIGTLGELLLSGVNGVAVDAGTNRIVNVAAPTQQTDAANKAYVDGIAVGISAMPSVNVIATSNVALTGLQTIDGLTLTAGMRVLLIGQSTGSQNGIWNVASGAWSRPTPSDDYYTGRTNVAGAFVFVEQGTNYAGSGWIQLTQNATVDTTATAWTQFTKLGDVTAGVGLIKVGTGDNTIAINLASNSGLQFTSGALDHLLNTAGGLNKTASGLGVTVNTNATLAVDANGLRTLGLPALFTVAGTAVDANVTATNLNVLNDGNSSLADTLHSHRNVLEAQATVAGPFKNGAVALAAGDPVQWSATADTLARCDAATSATSLCIGVAQAAIAANGTGKIVLRGTAAGVLTQATPGVPYYLASGGGLTATLTTAFSGNIVRAGYARNATDLEVNCTYLGQRAGN